MDLREAAQQATPREQLLKELMDSRVPKTEREHAAAREIERLRAALADDSMQRLTDVQQEIENDSFDKQPASGIHLGVCNGADRDVEAMTDVQQMIERGTKAWADVPNATAWVEELRGNEPVTGCHKTGRNKLSPPLPTLAVHVGYRYQSPVGGWEYGDHLPAGFDTGNWAHQKIYILQEQS